MRAKLCFVLLAMSFLEPHSSSARQWTDTTGRFSVEAELVRVHEGKVYLKKTDGKVIGVPIEKLSEADQRFLREYSSANLGTPDPKNEFNKIVTKVKERASRPVGILEQTPQTLAGGSLAPADKWIRTESEYKVEDYSVKKTGPTASSYVGRIVVTRRFAVYIDPKNDQRGVNGRMPDRWFDSEAAAMRATKYFYEDRSYAQKADEFLFTVDFAWKDGRWVQKELAAALLFPYSDEVDELVGYKRLRGNTYVHSFDKSRNPPVRKTYEVSPGAPSKTPAPHAGPNHKTNRDTAVAKSSTPDLAAEITDIAMTPSSQLYRKRGFGDFEFGSTYAQIMSFPAAAPLPQSEGIHQFYYDKDKKLVGYARSYLGEAAPRLQQLRLLFGRAPAAHMTNAALRTSWVNTVPTLALYGEPRRSTVVKTTDSLLIRYYFPEVVVYMRPESVTYVEAGVPEYSEAVVLKVFDRAWLAQRIEKDLAEKHKVLKWIRQIITHASRSQISSRLRMRTYSGTLRKKTSSRNMVRLAGTQGRTFLDVIFPATNARGPEKGSIMIKLYMEALPNREPNDIRSFGVPLSDVTCATSLLTQGVFPPKDDQVTTSTVPSSHTKTYEWMTTDGWSVTVLPRDVFVFQKDASGR